VLAPTLISADGEPRCDVSKSSFRLAVSIVVIAVLAYVSVALALSNWSWPLEPHPASCEAKGTYCAQDER
jgi:hypothetical protein